MLRYACKIYFSPVFSRGDTVGLRHATELPQVLWTLKIAAGHALIPGEVQGKASLLKHPLLNQLPLHSPWAKSTHTETRRNVTTQPHAWRLGLDSVAIGELHVNWSQRLRKKASISIPGLHLKPSHQTGGGLCSYSISLLLKLIVRDKTRTL